MPDLPCDGDDVCMVCHAVAPPLLEIRLCYTCVTAWHAPCLSHPIALSEAAGWTCPDCSGDATATPAARGAGGDLVAAIWAIEADNDLSEHEKARRRQELLLAGSKAPAAGDDDDGGDDTLGIIGEIFSCVFCMNLPDRPVTTRCGHNSCLKCFQKWIHSGHKTCGTCRAPIPHKVAEQPRINTSIVEAIRAAKIPKVANSAGSTDRPEKAFTTDRAKKAGKANEASGQIFVTIEPDHFGPILAQHDPKKNTGVRVGDTFKDRQECRQWGAHFPHIARIAGQSKHGAQSVALSGGYEEDKDHGEWFLYTGSGGRDLSRNKRTSKLQSFDQTFDGLNEALRLSCLKGYPVRVVRRAALHCIKKIDDGQSPSHKGRSSYAPLSGVRYDGIYGVERCWRKVGIQGTFKVCSYLFVRCDNEPAPWTSPRPLPEIEEVQGATDITEREGRASWDYDEKEGWKWMVPPPISKKADKQVQSARKHGQMSATELQLKDFGCCICHDVLKEPLTTPCAHNFCMSCLLGAFECQSSVRKRSRGGRTLRPQKIVKKCPFCLTDICDFLESPQINREMKDMIDSLQREAVDNAKRMKICDDMEGIYGHDTPVQQTVKSNEATD